MTYNAEADLEYIEKNIFYFAYSVGLTPTSLDDLTIDDLIAAIKNVVKVSSTKLENSNVVDAGVLLYRESPEYLYLRAQKISLIRNIRRFWYLRQLTIGAINRG